MPLDDLWVGDLVGVEVAGHPVLLINLDDEVRAYENRCPHQATPLSEGELDGELLTCYAHLWEFDARTGQGVNPATACLRQYAVRVEDDGTVSVAVPQG
jgi:toluene monooxygenase system ferredoxin subunit